MCGNAAEQFSREENDQTKLVPIKMFFIYVCVLAITSCYAVYRRLACDLRDQVIVPP